MHYTATLSPARGRRDPSKGTPTESEVDGAADTIESIEGDLSLLRNRPKRQAHQTNPEAEKSGLSHQRQSGGSQARQARRGQVGQARQPDRDEALHEAGADDARPGQTRQARQPDRDGALHE